ncbi:MAG: hypothetical protein GVY24_03600 [Planctomycetes bacterium]|nr:hypothetical protein [Phycisphaerae bacterium]NBC10805.1 hypothetical protein [Planctomycetota bacterium]
MTRKNCDQSELRWQIRVRIFKDPVIVRQLGLAIGIPFGLLAVLFTVLSFQSRGALYGLGLIGLLMVLTWLFVMVVYGGKYDAEFILDDKGVSCRTQSGQARKNRVINTLTVGLGLLAGKPGVAGAGALAASRQQVFIRWNRVRKARFNPRTRTILIRGGFAEHIALFCTAENYALVEQSVKAKTGYC